MKNSHVANILDFHNIIENISSVVFFRLQYIYFSAYEHESLVKQGLEGQGGDDSQRREAVGDVLGGLRVASRVANARSQIGRLCRRMISSMSK